MNSTVALIVPPARVSYNMTMHQSSGVPCIAQFADNQLSAYSTVSLIDKTPRSDYMPPIDPCLLGGIHGLDYEQHNCATPPVPRFQPSPAESSLDGHLAHTACNGPAPDLVAFPPLGYMRHESPFSIQNSPGYSFAPSPSIGSDMYHDLAHGPATPPDAPTPFCSLPGPRSTTAFECPQSNAYIDPSGISSYPTPQHDDTESVSEHSFFGIGIGIVDSYQYGTPSTIMRSPSLIPRSVSTDDGYIAAENGANNQFFPAMPSYHDNSMNNTCGMTTSSQSPKHDTTVGDVVAIKDTQRRGRAPRYPTVNAKGKRAIPYIPPSSHVDKRQRFMSNPKLCSKCRITFQTRRSYDQHIKFKHPRPYVCVFHYAGCTSRFDAKNEWKRHVATKHLGLRYWLCTKGACAEGQGPTTHNRSPALPEYGSIFNRKDLYTQHVRRMHSHVVGQTMANYKRASRESDERLKQMQDAALKVRCELPKYMPCPAKNCPLVFRGPTAWDDRMEHVAQQHFESAAAGKEPPVQFGGPDDEVLIEWAQRPDVNIVRRTASGWELCDPLKGDGGFRPPSPETFDEDAEGEEL